VIGFSQNPTQSYQRLSFFLSTSQIPNWDKSGREIRVSFGAELRPEQREAIEQVISHDQGILSAPTAFGKTIVVRA
jgi:superfamily II DNA or RNA helicase